MWRRDKDDEQEDSADLGVWALVMLVGVVGLLGATASAIALKREAMRPMVGDMIVFRPGVVERSPWRINVTAWRVDPAGQSLGTCTLSSSVMASGGGSLVVEVRLSTQSGRYLVHWAGARTDADERDCGPAADLMMSRVDIRKLATAAGGFGLRLPIPQTAAVMPPGPALP
ncbi:MAG: hypothetical protein AB7F35_01620 [Acetobacteraceae bacterium]